MSSKQKDIDAIVGCVLRKARLASGNTMASLAAHCGVTHQQLQKYESGTNRVSVSRLFVLSGALGVTPAVLIAQVQELVKIDKSEPVDTEWDRLQFAKPEHCRKVISGLASIRDTDVLQSVLNLLAALGQDEGRMER
jgi:transcriptional regulator with XRE-family HTH domain